MKGTLYVIATPLGNLKDITLNAIEKLKEVDLILAEDTRVSINLLRHYEINNKLESYHKFNEKSETIRVINYLKEGKNIALITDAGTPTISDPGSILVNECIKNNLKVTSIPGPSAVITALSVSGFNINSFTFYGFLSREKGNIIKELKIIINDSSTLAVIYESPKRIIKTLNIINEVLKNPNICICNDLTKKFERIYYGKLETVLEELENNDNKELGEYVIVIEKNQIEEKTDSLSLEAILIDKITKENITIKDAIKELSKNNDYSKNDLYQASLNFKKILGGE